ncbi:SDR family oxidoreductase [Flavobacterium sp. CYK-55]|uniref:SDR family oxidoreductase n=1 Tax=Flavobacterium sp. CYK-55 TaxID=2835529 RepID=UPI001BD125FD|nr:SDR family oxidoreductase [Flavobacterium sp. CYK-55]MBS7787604.1 SDR family oxidoreductase [Flavobacterium sp. CYK-55]
MKTISVLGCGWLGRPLAHRLLLEGYHVHGATTSEGKLTALEAESIIPFLIKIEAQKITGDWVGFTRKTDVLMVNIPPSMRRQLPAEFVQSMKNLCALIEKSTIEQVIFVSSTSVFQDQAKVFSEEDKPKPDTENGQALLEVEEMFFKIPSVKTTVIRFGGLIGSDRHPVKFLSGRLDVPAPKSVVNLIHLDDCIEIILMIIQQNISGEILHGVAPFHPTREQYYTQKAIELHLPLPMFNTKDLFEGKTIISDKLTTQLGYRFLKPEL